MLLLISVQYECSHFQMFCSIVPLIWDALHYNLPLIILLNTFARILNIKCGIIYLYFYTFRILKVHMKYYVIVCEGGGGEFDI